MNYYNDNDPRAAAWLRELIKDGLIPPGDVDERSIVDVTADDVQGYTQCHFFAGIGGWPYALRLAGWPDDRPVWTGSCPCQPFSTAGKRQGEKDPRHLWPEFRRLITECHPPVVFGEQVASAAGRLWLSGVRADLEALGYAVGAADLCAAGVGAPHIRQRLFWVADAESQFYRTGDVGPRGRDESPDGGTDGGLAYSTSNGRRKRRSEPSRRSVTGGCGDGRVVDARNDGLQRQQSTGTETATINGSGSLGFWSHFIWLPCADGKARRIEPTIFPLVDGLPGRVGLLRGAGNAIVPQVTAEFIRAYCECCEAA